VVAAGPVAPDAAGELVARVARPLRQLLAEDADLPILSWEDTAERTLDVYERARASLRELV